MKSRSLRAALRRAGRAMNRWLSTLHATPGVRSARAGRKTPSSSRALARAARGQPASGRATALSGGASSSGAYRNAFGTRRYELYVPRGYRGLPLPLVVMLHGCTQDADDFAGGTRMNELADELGFLVVYPIQSRAANAYHCWNWFEPSHQQRDAGEPSLIAGIVRKVMRSHAVQPGRVHAAGMSAGGAMAVVLAATYPELFTSVGVHSGLPYGCARDANSAYAAMKHGAARRKAGGALPPVPVIVFHGEDDEVVHPVNGVRIVEQFVPLRGQRAPATEQIVTSTNGRTCRVAVHRGANGLTLAEHWRVEGAGHAWCGGSRLGRHTDPLGPDASREMLRFFAERTSAPAFATDAAALS